MRYAIQLSFIIVTSCLVFVVSARSCAHSSDCSQFEVCGSDAQCNVRSLWSDYRWQDSVGAALIFLGAAVAAGGGIGGGGVFIPLFTLVVGMTAKQAIPVSQATIFGGSLVNLAFNVKEKHPKRANLPLIDCSIAMMFTPMLLAGTTIGVILNVIFPTWLVTSLLIVIMGFISIRTTRKARATWNQEVAAELDRQGSGIVPLDSSRVALRNDTEDKSDSRNDRFDAFAIFLIWVFVVMFTILKGSKSGGSSVVGVQTCSITFWLLNGGLLVSLVLLTLLLGRHLKQRSAPKYSPSEDDEGEETEIKWDNRSTILYPILSAAAGIVGGLLGIGGGMVLAPLLLEIGLHGRVVSATAATAVLITASSAFIQYLLLDLLIPSYSIFYFFLGAIATAFGQFAFDYLVRRYQRTSLLSISVAVMIILATILLLISGISETIQDYKKGHLGFSQPC